MNKRIRKYGWAVIAALACWTGLAVAQEPPAPPEAPPPVPASLPALAAADDSMKADVLYTVPPTEQIIEPALIDALAKAATQTDQATRLETLQAISEYRFTQLADQVKALLADQRVTVRTAAVHAASVLQLKDTAATIRPWLTSVEPDSSEQVNLLTTVDRTLAGFGDRASQAIWLTRVKNTQSPASLRVSAIGALTEMHVGFAPELIAAAMNAGEPTAVRLAAADAIAVFGHMDGFDRGGELFAPYAKLLSGSLTDRLVAARMLSGEQVPAAVPLLQRAAGDKEPAVQAIALMELKRRGEGALTLPIIEASVKSADPKVRLIAIEGLPLHPVRESVDLAAAAMNDPHPSNRAAARASLVALDQTAMGKWVRNWLLQAVDSLGVSKTDQQAELWGEAEQWALLARDVKELRAAEPLTKFLAYPRVEVVVAAIKAMRLLDVGETHQALLSSFTQMVTRMEEKEPVIDFNGEIARQAAMTLGVWRMKEADGILRHGIGKEHPLGYARPAVIWALGLIHEGQYDGGLAGALNGRINDTRGMIPESEDVRMASVIALGRMKGKQSLGVLRQHLSSQEEGDQMHYACQWAVQQITGQLEAVPPILPSKVMVPFLSPMR